MKILNYAGLLVIFLAVSLAAGCGPSDNPTASVNKEEFYMTTVPVAQIIDTARRLSEATPEATPRTTSPLDDFEFRELSDDEADAIVRYVPERFRRFSARVYEWPEGDWIYFRYSAGIMVELTVLEHPFGAARELPTEFTEVLTVKGDRAYLVRGWPFAAPRDGVREWFWDETGRLALYFRSGDRVFEIDVMGREALTKEEIIMIAESIGWDHEE